MGLFDTIHCEHPLPDACTANEFQTKSLACGMDTYRLTSTGRLQDNRGADTGIHGVLRLYTGDTAGGWWEYEAKFTDGQLVHLVQQAQARYSEDGRLLDATAEVPMATGTPTRDALPRSSDE